MRSPKSPRRKRPKKKTPVKIDYPPVPQRTWVPPDKRKHKIIAPPQYKYKKPETMNVELAKSSLDKVWHAFLVRDEAAWLFGTFSQTHKRFLYTTNGFQGPCNCIVALVFAKMVTVDKWNQRTLNSILLFGDNYYMESKRKLNNMHKKHLQLHETYKSFYIESDKISIEFAKKVYRGLIHKDLTNSPYIGDVVKDFFGNNEAGILVVGSGSVRRYFALWKFGRGFFMFDPTEHDSRGFPWENVPGLGMSLLVRYANLDRMVGLLQINLMGRGTPTSRHFKLVACTIKRLIHINTKYPECLEDANLEKVDKGITQKVSSCIKPVSPPQVIEEIIIMSDEEEVDVLNEGINADDIEIDEISDGIPQGDASEAAPTVVVEEAPKLEEAPKPKRLLKEPAILNKPRPESVTYFTELSPKQQGILRCQTHQADIRFSKVPGRQSLANAVAALTTLKLHRTKYWTGKILLEILKLGERIFHDRMQGAAADAELNFNNTFKLRLYDDLFTMVYGEPIFGMLQSDEDGIVDLAIAIDEGLQKYGMLIIKSPAILAIWKEGDFFYMFDPNERDQNGRSILKEMQIGSVTQLVDFVPGKACVTWFASLKDLVDLYVRNLDRSKRRGHFVVLPTDIVPYKKLPEKFHNFTPLCTASWILSGNFSQSDNRFGRETRNTQCTANAAISVAVFKVKPVKDWTLSTIDSIILNGNTFYMECVASLKAKNKYQHSMLMSCELNKDFVLNMDNMEQNFNIEFTIQECLVNGIVDSPEINEDILNLRKGLLKFFNDNDAGIVTCRCLSIAVMKHQGCFYYFDSHDRDKNGFFVNHGKSCMQRYLALDKMVRKMQANLRADNGESIYNISAVSVEVVTLIEDSGDEFDPPVEEEEEEEELEEEEVDEEEELMGEEEEEEVKKKKPRPKPLIENDALEKPGSPSKPLRAFTPVNKVKGILRASFDQENEMMFDTNAGKQLMPNLLTALGMIQLYKPLEWNQEMLDDVLVRGNKLYNDCMEDYYKRQAKRDLQPIVDGEDIEKDSDEVTLESVLKKYLIGINEISVEVEMASEGEIGLLGEGVREQLEVFYGKDPEHEEDYKEVLFTCEDYSVALFQCHNNYYLFDPRPRTERGDVFGKGDWSIVMIPVPVLVEFGPEPEPIAIPEVKLPPGVEKQAVPTTEQVMEQYNFDDDNQEEEEDEESDYPPYPQPEKHAPEYWLEQIQADGKACLMWFSKLKFLIDHIVRNLRPSRREHMPFQLQKIKITNEPKVRDVYDPQTGPKQDKIAGDWNNFKEIDRGKWILRGMKNQRDLIFPEINRGRQTAANCLVSLGFASIYSMSKYQANTVDVILKYGDRLYTSTRRQRRKELQMIQDTALTSEEIEQMLAMDAYTLAELLKTFAVGDDTIACEVVSRYKRGEINAQHVEGELDVLRGLEAFFLDSHLGVLESKGVTVSIWKRGDTEVNQNFYMFDPTSKGPAGGKAEIGMACVTRFTTLRPLAKLFLRNLPKCGSNEFVIHRVSVRVKAFERPIQQERDMCPKEKVTITGFGAVIPGKKITRGSISQEHPCFGRGANVTSAPIALVALAMTMLHDVEYWTKPLIDEIIIVGDQVYADALEKDLNFNPWVTKMTVALAPKEFRCGKAKVSCELRNTDQRGYVDIKHANILNLRQGLEKFFEENTMGVIQTEYLTVAVWESKSGEVTSIYMFDPSPRCPYGMPDKAGVACILKFLDYKLAAEHFTALVANTQYLISPIEIAIELDGRRKKTKKYKLTAKALTTDAAKHESLQKKHLGRMEFYTIPSGELAVLRGTRNQNSRRYSSNSRGFQDIPNCIIAYVMEKLVPLNRWTYKIIDMVLDTGDQLYKDSFVTYNPKDKKLNLENLLRDIVVRDALIKIAVSAPFLWARFTVRNLTHALEMCLDQKNFCVILVDKAGASVFKKDAFFYMFDPHDVDLHGNVGAGAEGCASVIRFKTLPLMVNSLLRNLDAGNPEKDMFCLIICAVKEIQKVGVGERFEEGLTTKPRKSNY